MFLCTSCRRTVFYTLEIYSCFIFLSRHLDWLTLIPRVFLLSPLMPIWRPLSNFSSPGSLGLFLVFLPAAVAGRWEGMKAVWAISFKQPRNVYPNCSPFTATMCACAQFTVVVFLRGLWYDFIGCSRCPFGCKCIYLYRNVHTRILENACVFFIYCNILELSFLKKSTPVYDSLMFPPPLFCFFSQVILLFCCSFHPSALKDSVLCFFLSSFPLSSYLTFSFVRFP